MSDDQPGKRKATLLEKLVLVFLGIPLALIFGAVLIGRLFGYSTYEVGVAIGEAIPYVLVAAIPFAVLFGLFWLVEYFDFRRRR